MGYSRPPLKITFDPDTLPELAGLEIFARRFTLDELRDFRAVLYADQPTDLSESALAEWGVDQDDVMLGMWLKLITSWNLEDGDGEPIAATLEAVKTNLDQGIIQKVGLEIYERSRSVAPPLPKRSADTQQSAELSIPTDVL